VIERKSAERERFTRRIYEMSENANKALLYFESLKTALESVPVAAPQAAEAPPTPPDGEGDGDKPNKRVRFSFGRSQKVPKG